MLVAYTNGIELIRALRPIVEVLRRHSRDMAKQVETAGTSIMHNIGEGSRREAGDRRRHYEMAHGSAGEIRAALDTAEAWGWDVDTTKARAILDRELGLLWGLVHGPKAARAARAAR